MPTTTSTFSSSTRSLHAKHFKNFNNPESSRAFYIAMTNYFRFSLLILHIQLRVHTISHFLSLFSLYVFFTTLDVFFGDELAYHNALFVSLFQTSSMRMVSSPYSCICEGSSRVIGEGALGRMILVCNHSPIKRNKKNNLSSRTF